jgi:branched-chain amino acid transport system permease protein
MDTLLLGLLNGISFGFILFLLASGLSIIMGVMGILNMAHGALYMLGAYVGWTLAVQCGLGYWVAVLAGALTAGVLGLVIERGLFRRLYKQYTEQVLLSFGILFVFTNVAQWIWGPIGRASFTAPAFSGSIRLGGFAYPTVRVVIMVVGGLLTVALWWLLEKTRLGAMVRAGMDNKEILMGLGIDFDRMSTGVFFLGAFLAGFAGVVGAQVLGASTGLALDIQLLAMVVIIVGGVGSVQGALLGGIVIATIDTLGRAFFPQLALFVIYLVMVAVLVVRPAGLLGRGR